MSASKEDRAADSRRYARIADIPGEYRIRQPMRAATGVSMNNLDHYGGINLHLTPIMSNQARSQIRDMVRESSLSAPKMTTPWPEWARQIFEREYTR